MPDRETLDCVLIGYNEPPFSEYERLIRQYGRDSEAYRDLQYSFVDLAGQKLTYVELMNHVHGLAGNGNGGAGLALKSGDIPSLAAAYLTNYLCRRGFAADYINLFQSEKERLSRLLAQNPVCVGITTTLYVVNFPVNEMVSFIREENPAVKIVVGGPLIANHARMNQGDDLAAALDDIGADFYVSEGQGEATLAALVACLRDGEDHSLVPNLLYFEKGSLVRTPRLPENNSMDENFVDWTALPGGDLGPTLQTRTARSCAFSCAFCNYPARAGKLALTSLEVIERELDSMRERGDTRKVVFIDDTFNVPLPRFKDICRLMIRKGYGFEWFSYFRCSNSDREAVELMAESGCGGVFLGIESGSPTILTGMHKAAKVDQYLRGIEWLKEMGILTFGSFITGFPGETAETVRETTDFIRESGLDYYRSQIWYNEPGTPIQLEKDNYRIEGDGFGWRHATMESLEAMDHIDRMFLEVDGSRWMPQWSFDFWIVPYLFGKGMTRAQFDAFMERAHRLLAIEIASVSGSEREMLQEEQLAAMVSQATDWSITA